jgi:hypothetical protein
MVAVQQTGLTQMTLMPTAPPWTVFCPELSQIQCFCSLRRAHQYLGKVDGAIGSAKCAVDMRILMGKSLPALVGQVVEGALIAKIR